MTATFLDQLAQKLAHDFQNDFQQAVVVLPNKRAKLFLLAALQKNLTIPVFAPQVISIEDFIETLAGLQTADSITQLFEFYEVYCQQSSSPQSFELFANWAKTLLQDFNDLVQQLPAPRTALKFEIIIKYRYGGIALPTAGRQVVDL